jgi:hypothetical protein
MLLNDIEENETTRTNPHDDLNPLFEHHDDSSELVMIVWMVIFYLMRIYDEFVV